MLYVNYNIIKAILKSKDKPQCTLVRMLPVVLGFATKALIKFEVSGGLFLRNHSFNYYSLSVKITSTSTKIRSERLYVLS
jgi:hypothetical protein